MIWDILEKKITDAGLGVAGTSLFRHEMPADCMQGVLFKSPLVGVHIDPYLPGYYKPVLQVVVRHPDPVDGERLASQVADALKVGAAERFPQTAERGAVQIKQFFAREMPIRFPRLDGNTIEWSINFQTAFVISERS